ncbi:MAG: B12-binding domain-containing radical SAM protein [Planctomycetes bacterium]|nr:B12-binding domain-containing radical SAM protein [Planctomycetota bacterium]
MEILLVNPRVREWAQPNCFPTGLGYIASYLRLRGYDVEVWDFNAMRQEDLTYEGIIRSYKYDVLGITGIITQYNDVKELAKFARDHNPDVKIVCGGTIATSIPEVLLETTCVDRCILGEGEIQMVEYLRSLKSGRLPRVPGLIEDLQHLPRPAYDKFPMEVYLNNPIAYYNTNKWIDGRVGESDEKIDPPKSINMIGSRGCPYNCIFCYHNYMGDKYRVRDPLDIFFEISYLINEYDVGYVHFVDDAFVCNKAFVEEFCSLIKPMGIKWSCSGRVNVMTDELAETMASAGCLGVCYGLESASQVMLDRMNKKVSVDQYRKAIEINKRHFVYEDYTFVIGTPGETDGTVAESVNFCEEMGITPTSVFYMTPYPGTPLFSELVRTNKEFRYMVCYLYTKWISGLGEQGEQVAWDCCGVGIKKLHEWKELFIEETGAWNKKKHS